ncbi:putative transcription factor C2H2 family [Helianthus anomalus]
MAEPKTPCKDETLKVSLPPQHELDKDDGGGPIRYDCIVCLCEVTPGDTDGFRMLPNCNHGFQFHGRCIEPWLKDHPTCPLCRSHVPQPVCHRLNVCLTRFRDDFVSYCHLALENVANNIGDGCV